MPFHDPQYITLRYMRAAAMMPPTNFASEQMKSLMLELHWVTLNISESDCKRSSVKCKELTLIFLNTQISALQHTVLRVIPPLQ